MPPAVRPEEEIDFRSLAERLEENRMKKEEEHAEKYKLSNMIYSGMDDDEFEHIEKLEEKKREDEKQVRDTRQTAPLPLPAPHLRRVLAITVTCAWPACHRHREQPPPRSH